MQIQQFKNLPLFPFLNDPSNIDSSFANYVTSTIDEIIQPEPEEYEIIHKIKIQNVYEKRVVKSHKKKDHWIEKEHNIVKSKIEELIENKEFYNSKTLFELLQKELDENSYERTAEEIRKYVTFNCKLGVGELFKLYKKGPQQTNPQFLIPLIKTHWKVKHCVISQQVMKTFPLELINGDSPWEIIEGHITGELKKIGDLPTMTKMLKKIANNQSVISLHIECACKRGCIQSCKDLYNRITEKNLVDEKTSQNLHERIKNLDRPLQEPKKRKRNSIKSKMQKISKQFDFEDRVLTPPSTPSEQQK